MSKLLDLAKNIAALDERALVAMDHHAMRATLRELREEARAIIDNHMQEVAASQRTPISTT